MVTAQGIEAVVLSTQHDPDISLKDLQEAVMEEIIKPVLPANWLSNDTKYFINPTGNFVIGRPGLATADSPAERSLSTPMVAWQGMAAAPFRARTHQKWTAAQLMPAGTLLKTLSQQALPIVARFRCLTPLASRNRPPSASIRLAPGNAPMRKIEGLVRKHFDLRPKGLIEMLDLKRPIFLPTASYGHFGRTEDTFTWGANRSRRSPRQRGLVSKHVHTTH